MNRAVVFTYPDPSHVAAVLPVVAALTRRGESVTMFSGEASREAVAGTGAAFRAYLSSPGSSNAGPFGGMARRLAFAEALLPELTAFLREHRPRYLLSDSAAIWGTVAGQALGIPRISYRATFALHASMIDAEGLARMFYGSAAREAVLGGLLDLIRYYEISQRIDRAYGARTGELIASLEDRQDLNLVLYSRQLQWNAERFDASYLWVGRCLAGEPESVFSWEELEQEPIVYVSLGTVFNDQPEFFRACIEAFREAPYRVVMGIGRRVSLDALGPLPANVLAFDHIPQARLTWLMGRAALAICHGGANTVEECLRFGVPMLIYPQGGDQFPLAGRMQDLGAGIRLHPSDVSPDRLLELARRVIEDPEYRKRIAGIRESMAKEGGAAQACDAILRFADGLGDPAA